MPLTFEEKREAWLVGARRRIEDARQLPLPLEPKKLTDKQRRAVLLSEIPPRGPRRK